MKGSVDLSPFGTAREAVASETLPPSPGCTSTSAREILCWLRKVREPLRALYNLEDEIAYIAWELARWQEGLEVGEYKALILLILSALVHLRQGSTRIAWRDEEGHSFHHELVGRLLGAIQPEPGFDVLGPAKATKLMQDLVNSGRLGAIVGGADDFKPLVLCGSYLYLQKMLHLEDQFVEAMSDRLTAHVSGWSQQMIEEALGDVLARPACRKGKQIVLEGEQQTAVRAAVCYPLAIISGGPGTGKTTIVVSILRVLRRLGVTCEEIALAAPTGKAANRLGEAIKLGRVEIVDPALEDFDLANLTEPRTLHRLLGYSYRTGGFMHHVNNRLAERVVIVDEGSMIDLALMERLIRSLRDDSRFILLGDAHQLPSVEAGAVLRDLLADGTTSTLLGPRGVRLTHSHRMRREDENGRNILTVAQAIDRGDVPVLAASRLSDEVIVERCSVADITFHGVEFLTSSPGESTVLDEFLERWHCAVIRSRTQIRDLAQREYTIVDGSFGADDQEKLRQLFEHWERFRILCLTRVLPTGADRVNAVLHQRAWDEFRRDREHNGDLIPGEPVMMQVNDYNREIFNGDQGLILNVSDHSCLYPMAVFARPQGFAAFHVESLRPVLLHSYAMTVHKAQGSEFEKVVVILPDRDLPINTREILYTALTRSRQSVVIIGDVTLLEAGITRVIARDSGIAEKLRNAPH
jgi:exodeoxyribonuclease V alpha subunit